MTAFWSRSGLLASMRDAGSPPTVSVSGSGDYTTAIGIYAAIVSALVFVVVLVGIKDVPLRQAVEEGPVAEELAAGAPDTGGAEIAGSARAAAR